MTLDGFADKTPALQELNLCCFLHFAVTNAGRANADTLARTLDNRMNGLQIEIPPTLGDIVGVTDSMPKLWPAATDFTNFCHKNTLPLVPREQEVLLYQGLTPVRNSPADEFLLGLSKFGNVCISLNVLSKAPHPPSQRTRTTTGQSCTQIQRECIPHPGQVCSPLYFGSVFRGPVTATPSSSYVGCREL
jgi:hypothetical protein